MDHIIQSENVRLATLRLFKAFPINPYINPKYNIDSYTRTIPYGFVCSPEIVAQYPIDEMIMEAILGVYGLSAENLNQSFHKSWAKVKNTPMEQLVVEQLAHYLTTYGKERPIEYLEEKSEQWSVDGLAVKVADIDDLDLGKVLSRDENYIYIPKEKINIPGLTLTEDLKLVIIKGYTKEELREKALALLTTGIALAEKTITDLVEVLQFTGIQEKELSQIKNKEVRVILYKELNLIPTNPTEFLRFLIYSITGKTLLIKSPAVIAEIKEKDNIISGILLDKYQMLHGLEKLAEIFFRFKPLWLALRGGVSNRKIINRIRRLAKTYHKPMPEDFLNSITGKLKNNQPTKFSQLDKELDKANIWRKIRLAYALQFRTKDCQSILYRVRNGKSYAAPFNYEGGHNVLLTVLAVVLDSIVADIKPNIEGKSIYIPSYINYALPATEKMFTGNFPTGTYVEMDKDMIFGIHWSNVERKASNRMYRRIDLDLSTISMDGKTGWDASYRNNDSTILFSGDITNAPNGATELFYVKKQSKSAHILMVNYYNYDPEIEVPFKIMVAQETVKNFGENYMVDPNNVMAVTNSSIKVQQKILGLAVTTLNGCRFYFIETGLGSSITSSNDDYVQHSRQYLFDYYENSIMLEELLVRAGAMISRNPEISPGVLCDIDLSPEAIEKDTIIKLLTKGQ